MRFSCSSYVKERATLMSSVNEILLNNNLNHSHNQLQLYLYGHPSITYLYFFCFLHTYVCPVFLPNLFLLNICWKFLGIVGVFAYFHCSCPGNYFFLEEKFLREKNNKKQAVVLFGFNILISCSTSCNVTLLNENGSPVTLLQ